MYYLKTSCMSWINSDTSFALQKSLFFKNELTHLTMCIWLSTTTSPWMIFVSGKSICWMHWFTSALIYRYQCLVLLWNMWFSRVSLSNWNVSDETVTVSCKMMKAKRTVDLMLKQSNLQLLFSQHFFYQYTFPGLKLLTKWTDHHQNVCFKP